MIPPIRLRAGGSGGGVAPPAPNTPLLPSSGADHQTARQRLRAGGGAGPPGYTSSSSVTVFLQLCSRVVKLDVVGEL